MKHAKFESDTAEVYLAAFQKQWKAKGRDVGYSFAGPEAKGHSDPCYAPTANRLQVCQQDYFGLLYQGWSGQAMVQGMDKEAWLWMEYLVNPEGPFKDILPFLWHQTAEEICNDKGLIFYNLHKCNIALLWTFAQATRYMYENPGRMERFQYLVHTFPNDKPMALFCSLVIGPATKNLLGPWGQSVIAHGEPLGNTGIKRAHWFLNGIVTPSGILGTAGSSNCFGGPIDYDYTLSRDAAQRPLNDYVQSFQAERKAKNVNRTEAARAA